MPTSRSVSAALAAAGLVVAGGAVLAPATANTAGTGLVINEVYGGGGNQSAVFDHDFVELRNTTDHTVSLGGLSLQYRSSSSTSASGNVFVLPPVDVPAGKTYLIEGASNAAVGAALPTPDATSTLNLSGSSGQVYVAQGTTGIAPTGSPSISDPNVVDFVGWGSSVVRYEGTGPAKTTSAATSVSRDANGTDTNDNAADFTLADPPTPSACGSACGTTPPPPPTEHTIAEIQGTGSASPLKGKAVITQGVVTAAYPTGGFYGYTIQTGGTGGAEDATPGASDAVYVYQPKDPITVKVGDSVQVTGTVSEFGGLTELSVASTDVEELTTPLAPVTPLSIAYPTTDADREAHESELLAPTNTFTVTDNYSTNQYGEIGLATGTKQLWQPTDLYNPNTDPAGVAEVEADNAARAVTLDDGSSWNYLTTDKNTVMPWLRPDNPVRIGSTATLHAPVILDYRNSLWKFQPTSQVTDDGASVATFSDTRAANQAPQPVGGDLKLGTFNVLNYFNTTGKDWVASGHDCSFYNDRTGDPVTDNTCSDNGPRGAAESSGGTDLADKTADLERQVAKEVKAINTMDADIVSLEEIENSVALGEPDRDDALKSLVAALNQAAGTTRWAYVPSPPESQLPPLAEQDVIRTAFIYNPSKVELVGGSEVLSDQSSDGQPFENAREPLAQEFKAKGALDSDGFVVIVNHLKSKGSGVDDGTGQGNANPDRVAQAHALVEFANQVEADRGTDRVFLVGDFNSYTQEDPMQVLYSAGYANQASDDPRDTSYEFGGMAGSLDHVLTNDAAGSMVTGRDVWQIDAEESVGFEYSRYNYNAQPLYAPNQFRASDHNPEVVGLDAPFTQQGSTVTATASPDRIKQSPNGKPKAGTTTTVSVTVTGDRGITPTGTVELWVGNRLLATADLSDGSTSAVIGPFRSAGLRHIEVRYLGDHQTEAGSTTTTVQVTKGNSAH